jgi:hypothetical protein
VDVSNCFSDAWNIFSINGLLDENLITMARKKKQRIRVNFLKIVKNLKKGTQTKGGSRVDTKDMFGPACTKNGQSPFLSRDLPVIFSKEWQWCLQVGSYMLRMPTANQDQPSY